MLCLIRVFRPRQEGRREEGDAAAEAVDPAREAPRVQRQVFVQEPRRRTWALTPPRGTPVLRLHLPPPASFFFCFFLHFFLQNLYSGPAAMGVRAFSARCFASHACFWTLFLITTAHGCLDLPDLPDLPDLSPVFTGRPDHRGVRRRVRPPGGLAAILQAAVFRGHALQAGGCRGQRCRQDNAAPAAHGPAHA